MIGRRDLPLTERELEVARLIADGLKYAVVGDQMGIAKSTVRNHVTVILRKVHAETMTQAIAILLRRGVIR